MQRYRQRIRSLAKQNVPDRSACGELLKKQYCAPCNPFAGHFFANVTNPTPTICPRFAAHFRSACGKELPETAQYAAATKKTFYCSPFAPAKYFNDSGVTGGGSQTALQPAFPHLQGLLPEALTGAYRVSYEDAWWVTSQAGESIQVRDTPSGTKVTVVLNITDRVVYDGGKEGGEAEMAWRIAEYSRGYGLCNTPLDATP